MDRQFNCTSVKKDRKQCNDIRIVFLKAILFLIVIGYKSNAIGAEWTIEPNISVTGTYLDNVFLSPPGDEASDFVTEIDPEISIQAYSRRGYVNFDYRMQNLFYANNNSENTTNHELEADASSELYKNLLFLDLTASYRQVLISPEGRGGFNNLSITNDRTNEGDFTISPYFIKQFGNFAIGELRYTYGQVDYSGNDESPADTRINGIFVNLSSSPFAEVLAGTPALTQNRRKVSARNLGSTENSSTGTDTSNLLNALREIETPPNESVDRESIKTPSDSFQWNVSYQRDESNSADNINTRFEDVAINLGYLSALNLALLGEFGYQNDSFEHSSQIDDPVGVFWSVGIGWNPIRRTTVVAKVGERPFGNSYSFALQHYTRRTTVEIDYFEDYSNTASATLESNGGIFTNDPSNDLSSGTINDQGFIDVPLPGISNEVFLRKRFTGNISWLSVKSSVNFQLYNERRNFQLTNDDEQILGSAASWIWQPTSRTSSNLYGQWERLNATDGSEQDTWEIGLRVSRQISKDINGAVEFRHARQDASDAQDEYQQNSIAASISIDF